MNNAKYQRGVIAPTITIFNKDNTIDYEATKNHLNFLIDNGVHAIFSLGTTQENACLSEDEYNKLTQVLVEEVDKRIPIYIGVSTPATNLSIRNAKFAEAVGADAVFAGGPYYMKVTEEELMQFHRDIASAINIPYILYHNPGLSKLGLSVQKIVELTEEGTVKMIKDTAGGDPVRTQDLKLKCKPGTTVYYGDDCGAYQAMVSGADGWTAGISNFIPKECVKLWNLLAVEKKYEEGFELWKKILPVLEMTLSKANYGQNGGRSDWLQIYKEGAKIRNGTSAIMRRPLFELPDIDLQILKERMAELGY